jgi:hypothetical protein
MSIKSTIVEKEHLLQYILDIYHEEFHIVLEKDIRTFFNGFIPLLKDGLSVYIEYPYVEKHYRDSYYSYFSTKHAKYIRDSIRLSFFNHRVTPEEFRDINAFELLQRDFLGFMTLRPIRSQIVGRTVLSPEIFKTHDFVCCLVKYNVLINGVKLNVYGFPFCSQDGEMLTCAETTVLNLMEYFGTKYPEYTPILPSEIIKSLSERSFERLTPSNGLDSQDISFVLKEFGFATRIYFCDEYQNDEFRSIINCYVESGIPIIATIQNSKIGHAIIIIGRTTGHDRSLLRKLLDKIADVIDYSEFIDKYIVIDDNSFPYQVVPLNNPTIHYTDPDFKGAEIKSVIVPLYPKVYVDAYLARTLMKLIINEEKLIDKRGFKIKRLFLASSRTFKDYVNRMQLQKGDVLEDFDINFKNFIVNKRMPKFVWIAEGYDSIKSLETGFGQSMIVIDATEPNLDVSHLLFIIHQGYFTVYNSVDNTYEKYFVSLQPFCTFTLNLKGEHTKWQDYQMFLKKP